MPTRLLPFSVSGSRLAARAELITTPRPELSILLPRRDRSTAAIIETALRLDATEGFVQAALHLRDHRISDAITRRILLTKKRRGVVG